MDRSQLEIDGCILECAVWGQRSETHPTLVFLHDGLGCVSSWRDFPADLSRATGCPAFVYSRAGYGASSPVPLPRPVRFMHDEALKTLPRVLEKMEIADAVLIGQSDGASISLIHAESTTGGSVRGMILEAPHVFVEDITVNSIETAGQDYRNGDLRRRMQKHHGPNADGAFWGWHDVWLNPLFRSWNIEQYLAAVKAPVLVIQGERDEFGTSSQIEAIRRGCSVQVTTVVLPDCGHSPHKDQPEQTLRAMTEFILRLGRK